MFKKLPFYNKYNTVPIISTALEFMKPPKPYHIRRNWHYITYRTEIFAFLALLCIWLLWLLLFALCSPAYLNSHTPKTLLYTLTLSP